MTEEDRAKFRQTVVHERSIAGVLRSLGLRVGGANYARVHRLVEELRLDTSHWTGCGHLRGKSHAWARKRPLTEILKERSPHTTSSSLKKRLYRESLLEARCARCRLTEWNGEPLSLHLDHINGDSRDNRLENLRVLCPNCHSQTPTYCGRNKKRRRLSTWAEPVATPRDAW